jgi:integrase
MVMTWPDGGRLPVPLPTLEELNMGYVTYRHSRWYAIGYQGIDPITGNDRRQWHRAESEQQARDLAATLPSATTTTAQRGITLARYMHTRWLPERTHRLRPTTSFRYTKMADRYLLPTLGRVPLRHLTVNHLQRLYQDLLTSGRVDGRPLAPKTVLNVHQIVRAALGDAERAGLVGRNVARLMKPPCHGNAPEQQCWNENELHTFLAGVDGHRLGMALRLIAMTGMRRSEALGLRWRDLDFTAGSLSIRRSVTCTGYQIHITPTKTATSRRAIDLDVETIGRLTQWRDEQRAANPTSARADHHLFTRPNGTIVHPHLLSQHFERTVARTELPRIRLHDLRHTHATLMLKNGVPLKVVSERLGHSSPAFTMAVYQHVLPGMQRDAANTFAQLIRAQAVPLAIVTTVDTR